MGLDGENLSVVMGFDRRYPSVEDLKLKSKKRIPKFAFEYLSGGANEEINLRKNNADFHQIELRPEYIKKYSGANMSTKLLGNQYDAPFGIAPIGLQGLIWPNSPEILAKAALTHNIPFVLSTVSTASIERIAGLTEGKFWFQLYHPADPKLRDSIIQRLQERECGVLVLLADTPSFGIRYKDVKNGLSLPPKLSAKNILQIISKPLWAFDTVRHGRPEFASLKQYMPKRLNMSQLGKYMNETFDGRLTEDSIQSIRDLWKGKLIVKGIVNESDLKKVTRIGVDGVVISNHGGRQIDGGESAIRSLMTLAAKSQITTMMDGGIRSGVDVSKAIACGADFVFMGRPFMYGVGALGKQGGSHTIALFKMQLQQIMEQLGCHEVKDLKNCLIDK